MFDAAIEAIKYDLAHYEAFNRNPHFDPEPEREKECRDALRVLEAAGKLSMDKTIDRLKAGMIPLALIDLLAAIPGDGE